MIFNFYSESSSIFEKTPAEGTPVLHGSRPGSRQHTPPLGQEEVFPTPTTDDISELKEMFKRCVMLAEDASQSAKRASDAVMAMKYGGGDDEFGVTLNDPFVSIPRPIVDVVTTNPFDLHDVSNVYGGTTEVKRRGRPPKSAN